MARGTLFSPVSRIEAVQAMSEYFIVLFQFFLLTISVLVSGWSENGWLSGGHAVRMALELCEFICLQSAVVFPYLVFAQRCIGLGPA